MNKILSVLRVSVVFVLLATGTARAFTGAELAIVTGAAAGLMVAVPTVSEIFTYSKISVTVEAYSETIPLTSNQMVLAHIDATNSPDLKRTQPFKLGGPTSAKRAADLAKVNPLPQFAAAAAALNDLTANLDTVIDGFQGAVAQMDGLVQQQNTNGGTTNALVIIDADLQERLTNAKQLREEMQNFITFMEKFPPGAEMSAVDVSKATDLMGVIRQGATRFHKPFVPETASFLTLSIRTLFSGRDKFTLSENSATSTNANVDHPAVPSPSTPSSATNAPATNAPATNAPATNAPATNAPATNAPATNAPATNAPATNAPATNTPPTIVPVPHPAVGAPVRPPIALEDRISSMIYRMFAPPANLTQSEQIAFQVFTALQLAAGAEANGGELAEIGSTNVLYKDVFGLEHSLVNKLNAVGYPVVDDTGNTDATIARGKLALSKLKDAPNYKQVEALLNVVYLPVQFNEVRTQVTEVKILTTAGLTTGANIGPIVNEAFQAVFGQSSQIDAILSDPSKWKKMNYAFSKSHAGNHNAIIYFDNDLTPILKTATFDPGDFIAANAQLYKRVSTALVSMYGLPASPVAGSTNSSSTTSMADFNIYSQQARLQNAKQSSTNDRKVLVDALTKFVALGNQIQSSTTTNGAWTGAAPTPTATTQIIALTNTLSQVSLSLQTRASSVGP